jgi:hypothetical protein
MSQLAWWNRDRRGRNKCWRPCVMIPGLGAGGPPFQGKSNHRRFWSNGKFEGALPCRVLCERVGADTLAPGAGDRVFHVTDSGIVAPPPSRFLRKGGSARTAASDKGQVTSAVVRFEVTRHDGGGKAVLPTPPATVDTPTLSHRTRKDGAPSKFVVSWEKGWATRLIPTTTGTGYILRGAAKGLQQPTRASEHLRRF